jgi:hypothetical protein
MTLEMYCRQVAAYIEGERAGWPLDHETMYLCHCLLTVPQRHEAYRLLTPAYKPLVD